MEGYVSSYQFFDDRLKALWISRPLLHEPGLKFSDSDFPRKLELFMKENKIVPQTAYLRAYFIDAIFNRVVVQWIDQSWPKIPQGQEVSIVNPVLTWNRDGEVIVENSL